MRGRWLHCSCSQLATAWCNNPEGTGVLVLSLSFPICKVRCLSSILIKGPSNTAFSTFYLSMFLPNQGTALLFPEQGFQISSCVPPHSKPMLISPSVHWAAVRQGSNHPAAWLHISKLRENPFLGLTAFPGHQENTFSSPTSGYSLHWPQMALGPAGWRSSWLCPGAHEDFAAVETDAEIQLRQWLNKQSV